MEDLVQLVDVLSELKDVSYSILEKMVPIMNHISEEGNDIVGEIASRSDNDDDTAREFVEDKTMNMVIDAETVSNEITDFAKAVRGGPDEIDANIEKFPFLAEVWYGDTYHGLEELIALKALLRELKTTEKYANEDWIIDSASKDLINLVAHE